MEDKKKEKESETPKGYYSNTPRIGNNGPSRLRREISKGMTFFVVIAASIAFYFALLRLTNISGVFGKVLDVLKPILYGLLIAFLLNPIVKQTDKILIPILKRKMKNEARAEKVSRTAGILLALIIMVLLISGLVNMLIPELYKSIRDLVFTLPRQINLLVNQIGDIQADESNTGVMMRTFIKQATSTFQDWLSNNLFTRVNEVMGRLTNGLIDFVSEIFNALIGVIVSIYVLYSKETFGRQCKKMTYALLSPSHANVVLHITQKSNDIFGGFLIGKIIDSAIIGVLCFIGLSFLNMPYTMLVSVIVGVTNVIPFFGPYIGAIPSAILILLADPLKGLYFIIFVIALQQFDGNVLGPKILGNSTGLSSFWVVFSILIAGGLFGIPGMLFGVPTFAVIYYIVNMLVNSILKKKELPTDTECYGKNGYVDSEGIYIQKEKQEEIKEIQEEKGDKDNADSSTK